MSPPFIFKIDEIGEDPNAPQHFDNSGHWIPCTHPGAHRPIGGGVSGRYWFCDRLQIYSVPQRPAGASKYKQFSVYFAGGRGFWLLRGDAINPRDDENWHSLSFDWVQGHTSFLTNAGQHSTLKVQPTDQIWPRMLLPDIHYAPAQPWHQNYGGLVGELPILLALIAFSTAREYLSTVLPLVFIGGAWQVHPYQFSRLPRRGVIVTVYTCPSTWKGGSTAEDLFNYENGAYGKYYY